MRLSLTVAEQIIPLPDARHDRVKLYVTHGIFSAGFEALRAGIDQIFVANPFPADLPDFVQIVRG